MSTPTTAPPSTDHLPAGYDDENSRWYIAPELRPHYRLATHAEIRRHFSTRVRWKVEAEFARLELRRRGEYELPDPPARTSYRIGYRSNADDDAREEYERLVAERDRRLEQLENSMTADDEAWLWHVEKGHPDAVRRKRRSDDIAAQKAAHVRQHTCDVCDEFEPSTAAVQLDVENGSVFRYGDGGYSRLPGRRVTRLRACFACTHHLAQLVADDLVLGRARREVVQGWLDDHLDAQG